MATTVNIASDDHCGRRYVTEKVSLSLVKKQAKDTMLDFAFHCVLNRFMVCIEWVYCVGTFSVLGGCFS